MESTYTHETNGMLTTLDGSPVGFLLTQERQGEDRVVRGFVYSADLATQLFWELTGEELTVEELAQAVTPSAPKMLWESA